MSLSAVHAELQLLLQAQLDACRSTHAFTPRAVLPPAGAATDLAAAAPLPAVAAAVTWPGVVLLQTPALQRALTTSALAAAPTRRSGGRPATAGGAGQADFTCRVLFSLAHDYRKAVQMQTQALAATAATDNTPVAALPHFDVDAALNEWGTVLQARLVAALQQRDSMEPGVATALADARVEAVRGYINITLGETQCRNMLSATASISSSSSSSTSAAASFLAASSSSAAAAAAAGSVAAPATPLSLATSFTMNRIGTWRSVYKETFGTPRQGGVVPEARGCLTLRHELGPDTLEGIEEYSHVWLLFVFHQNNNIGTNDASSSSSSSSSFASSKVAPPRLGGSRVGLFATRTPHRPNPLGLSLARLDRVSGRSVYLSGVDLVEGTPVVDLKPYHPADCLQGRDATTKQLTAPLYRVPAWMNEAPLAVLQVEWTQAASAQLDAAVQSGGLEFYSSHEREVVRQLITRLLEQDPRSLHSKAQHASGIFGVCVDRLDVAFQIVEQQSPLLPIALVFSVLVFAPDAERPRMRTKAWLDAITPAARTAKEQWEQERDAEHRSTLTL